MASTPILRAIRLTCAGVFVASVAGLIVSSVAGNNEGWVVTIGVVSATTAIVLIATSSVASSRRLPEFSDVEAERIEARISTLVAAGVDETELRDLVRMSIHLGRGL